MGRAVGNWSTIGTRITGGISTLGCPLDYRGAIWGRIGTHSGSRRISSKR